MIRDVTVLLGFAFALGCGSSKKDDWVGGDPGAKLSASGLAGLDKAKEGSTKDESETEGAAKEKSSRYEAKRGPVGWFDEMPRSSYPKKDSAVANSKARKWLKESFKGGQTVEWEVTVTDVKDAGDGPFRVTVYVGVPSAMVWGITGRDYGASVWRYGEPILLGDQRCQVCLAATLRPFYLPQSYFDEDRIRSFIEFNNCTEAEVEKLVAMRGKKVVLRGTVASKTTATGSLSGPAELGAAVLAESFRSFDPAEKTDDLLPIVFFVHQLSIDGFLPKSSREKADK